MTASIFFLIGSTKSYWSPIRWLGAGRPTLAVGLGAAALSFRSATGRKA